MTRLPGSSPLAIMTLREVRDCGVAGAGLVAFDLALGEVFWANRAGRAVLGLADGDSAFPANSVTGRQIKASSRLIETWGEARILVRSTVGRSSKALVATLQRIESAGIVLLTLPEIVPAPASEAAMAARLLADSGLEAAAVYGTAGPLAATAAFRSDGAEALAKAVLALLQSGDGGAELDGSLTHMMLGAVAPGLVLVQQEALPEILPTGDEETPAELTVGRNAFFSVRRRKLSSDRGRMSMTGLLQRWHTRQNGGDAAVPDAAAEPSADISPSSEATSEPHDNLLPEHRRHAPDAAEVAQLQTDGDAGQEPGGSTSETDQPQERESEVIVPDIAPEKAGTLDVPISGDDEIPAAETLIPSELEKQAAAKDASSTVLASNGDTTFAAGSLLASEFDGPALAENSGSSASFPGKRVADAGTEEAITPVAPFSGTAEHRPADAFDGPLPDQPLAADRDSDSGMPAAGTIETIALAENADDVPDVASADAPAPTGGFLPDDTTADSWASDEPAAADPDASAFVPRFDIPPVRFVWQIDRDGKFRSLTPEFSAAVGPMAADVAGRSFREVANVFGFVTGGEIARLLDRRDTWSGRSILWPVEGSDRKVPVDLAALPIYARDRSFDGFRGFGIVRMNESVVDPEAIGLILGETRAAAAPLATEAPLAPIEAVDAAEDAAPKRPLLTTFEAQAFGRRLVTPAVAAPEVAETSVGDTPKVIRLEERRRPRDGTLSQAEEAAFRAIGMKLGEKPSPAAKDSAALVEDAKIMPSGEPPVAEASPIAVPPSGGRAALPPEAMPDDGPATSQDDVDGVAASNPVELAVDDVETERADALDAPVAASEPTVRDGVPSPSPWASDVVEPAPAEPYEPAVADDARLADVSVPSDADDIATDERAEASATTAPMVNDADELADDDEEPGALAAAIEAVFASLPLPVLAEAHGALVYANREFQDLTGYESIAALEAVGGLDALFADRADPLQTGQLAIRRSNGQLLDVRVHMQRATFSSRSFLLMSFTPSPRDAAALSHPPEEEAFEVVSETADLRQQVEELQAVLDTATDGVVLLDPAGTIRAMNGSAHALFGIGQDDHTGRHLSSLFAHESQKATLDYLDMLRDDGLAGILNDGREVIGRVAQGGFIPLFITIGRLSGERGWCVVIRDIAHWKRIEEDLVNARRQAEAASLHKSRFLANISHELRTPLNAIIGFADVMASECFGPIGNERYLEYLGDIKRSGHHVLDLVNDLLDISKIEAGKLDLAFEAVSLNEVVSEVVSLMQPQANRERVIVRSNLPSSVPPVVADRRTMRQIALNLVANAIRFTPAGGQIIASTTYTADGDVLLRFRDSGIGMTEREIEIALTPFQQVHAPSANRGEGTGLGLPLTKAMVEANRALFAITSTPNEGTLVEISFPSQRVLAD